MRVAFVTVGKTDRLTGGYLYNAALVSGLRKQEVEVEEVVASGASPAEQAQAASNLGSRLDPEDFDVLVVDALARVVCAPHLDRWRERRPVVAMVHELPSVVGGSESSQSAEERRFEAPLLRAERLVCVSGHGRTVLLENGAPGERVRVVRPGFDRLPLARVGAERPEEAGGPPKALCVAQWIPRKGIADLVRAWGSRERPGAVLELVGETDADPAYAAEVRAEISAARERTGAEILVAGPLRDEALVRAYASADLFVLPSRYEGYGIVFAEALAGALPVLACEAGPVPEVVGREAARLVPPGDVQALSGALDRLLSDPELRADMSAAARRRARSLPSWEETVSGFLRTLKEAAESGDGGPVGSSALREQNRRSWNAAVGALDSHRGDLAGFLRGGGTTLFPEERELLGEVSGKRVAHLMCNSGGDSVSLALMGAEVTGVDISDGAVAAARRLAAEVGVRARFERADVYDWLSGGRAGRFFEVVFASYGVVCWLPDLTAWARGIRGALVPGGRLVLLDFHPVSDMLGEGWELRRSYPAGGERLTLPEGVGDYVAESAGALTPAGFAEGVRGFENPQEAHLFGWGVGELVTALARSGLRVTALKEYPYSNGERKFVGMKEIPGRRLVPPAGVPRIPLMYGVTAEKEGAGGSPPDAGASF